MEDHNELDLEEDFDELEFGIEERILRTKDGKPLEDAIELWANNYFQTVMDILNGFFSHVTPDVAVERMEAISFTDLVRQQLEDEPEEVIQIALTVIEELKDVELEFMRAYC